MAASWEDRIASFWESADDQSPDLMLSEMKDLVDERPQADPVAVYEWAAVHDFLGREAAAVPLYRLALDAGLSGPRRPQAVIQLASSLRNIGDPGAAVDLLIELFDDEDAALTGAAAHAFLALALHDLGRTDEALRVALKALAPTLPFYGRSVSAYADDIVRPRAGE
jgi:tetratricopeptide (TPR) repeat protein